MLLLPPYRRGRDWGGGLGGCIVTSAGGGWPGVRAAKSKAGEGTRCRRARTSCQERTCGHLRFVIGQCIAGRSPPCTPRMRQGASWPLAEEGGRGLPTCRWVQGLPAEEIVWGSHGYVPFSLCGVVVRSEQQDSCQAGHTLWSFNTVLTIRSNGQNPIRLCRGSVVIPMSNRMSLPIHFCKPFVRETSITCRQVGHRTGHRPQDGAWRMASAQTNWPHGFTGRTSKIDVPLVHRSKHRTGPSLETNLLFMNQDSIGCACAGACACGIVLYHARVLLVSM